MASIFDEIFMSKAFLIGRWSYTGSMNYEREDHTSCVLTDGKVLVAGGRNDTGPLNTVELYDPSTGFWTMTGSMNIARAEHAVSALTNGKVLVT
ncbi:unnamed protein product, partial [Rotaria sordida]